METVIEVENLDIVRSGVKVINAASFSIEKGDFVGVVGPNGGGKTTLIKGLLGTIPVKRGKVKLFGTELQNFKQWNRIGFVSQTATKFDDKFPLTVRELVGLGRVFKGNTGKRLSKKDWQKTDEVMEYMGIADLRDRRIGQLSGGEKQRVFVAKALVRDPELLILDEPVTGVDTDAQVKFYKTLSQLVRDRGTTILEVSHDLSVVFCQMTKVICVNRDVYYTPITADLDETELLRKVYGEHFTILLHKHECWWDADG